MMIVLDTSILISALVRNGFVRNFIFDKTSFKFLTPAYTLSEINKYKQEICGKAEVSDKQFYELLDIIFSYVKIINPLQYSDYMGEADKIIGHIHKTDVPFIATALAFNCSVWSDDKHFKKQDRVKVLTSKDMIKMMREDTK